MVRVKICGLTRRQDVEWAIECGADAVGFVFEQSSPRCLSIEEATVLANGLPPYLTRVAVHVEASPYGLVLEAIQAQTFPGKMRGKTVQVARLKQGSSVEEIVKLGERADAILLDAFSNKGYGGTGEKVDWGLASEIVAACPKPVILAGGLDADNVALAICQVRPYAVDVASGVESSPGIKDRELVRRFIDAAKSAG